MVSSDTLRLIKPEKYLFTPQAVSAENETTLEEAVPCEEEHFCTFALQRDNPLLRKWKLIRRHLWDRCVCSPLRSHPSALLISASMKFNLISLKGNGSRSPSLCFQSLMAVLLDQTTTLRTLVLRPKTPEHWLKLPDLHLWNRNQATEETEPKRNI